MVHAKCSVRRVSSLLAQRLRPPHPLRATGLLRRTDHTIYSLEQFLVPNGGKYLFHGTYSHRNHQNRSSSSNKPGHGHSQKRQKPRYRFLVLLGAVIVGYACNSLTSPVRDDVGAFKHFTLDSREDLSPTSAIFTVRPQGRGIRQSDPDRLWSVEFKQPYIQIGRDYTPLPKEVIGDQDDGSLTFLIRKDPNGEMCRYLYSLPLGSTLDIRGPKTEYHLPMGTQNLIFLAGGTGIAPALQAADVLLSRNDEAGPNPKVHILWANRRREDCIGAPGHTNGASQYTMFSASRLLNVLGLKGETSTQESMAPISAEATATSSSGATTTTNPIIRHLTALQSQYPSQVSISYFVDSENSFITTSVIQRTLAEIFPSSSSPPPPPPPSSSPSSSQPSSSPIVSPRSASLEPSEAPLAPASTQILISGPEGFISYLAGPKPLVSIPSATPTTPHTLTGALQEQGEITGVIGEELRRLGFLDPKNQNQNQNQNKNNNGNKNGNMNGNMNIQVCKL